jgi:hypothetical protein
MRAAVTVVLLLLAFWRAALDWQATIGRGYAYRFGSLGDLVAGYWPERHAWLVEGLRQSGISWVWDPVGAFVLSLPVAPALAAVAIGLWISRERTGARARARR